MFCHFCSQQQSIQSINKRQNCQSKLPNSTGHFMLIHRTLPQESLSEWFNSSPIIQKLRSKFSVCLNKWEGRSSAHLIHISIVNIIVENIHIDIIYCQIQYQIQTDSKDKMQRYQMQYLVVCSMQQMQYVVVSIMSEPSVFGKCSLKQALVPTVSLSYHMCKQGESF